MIPLLVAVVISVGAGPRNLGLFSDSDAARDFAGGLAIKQGKTLPLQGPSIHSSGHNAIYLGPYYYLYLSLFHFPWDRPSTIFPVIPFGLLSLFLWILVLKRVFGNAPLVP